MKVFILGLLFLNAIKIKPSDIYVLESMPKTIIGCGGILVAGEFFFINSKDSTQKIGIVLCPDGLGDNFFKLDNKYEITFSEDSILPKSYSAMNVYDIGKNYIPKRLINNIKKVK